MPPRAGPTGAIAPETLDELLEISRRQVADKLARGVEVRAPAALRSTELVQLSVRVPDEVRRQVRDAAHRADTSVQQLVLDALCAHLRRVEEVDVASPGIAEFAEDYWQLVRRGDYRRDIDSLDDPELAVQ